MSVCCGNRSMCKPNIQSNSAAVGNVDVVIGILHSSVIGTMFIDTHRQMAFFTWKWPTMFRYWRCPAR